MKSKLLIIGVLCAIAFTANAQTEKGKNFINGSVGYRSTDQESNLDVSSNNNSYQNTSKILNIMPRYGHFFGKNLAVGLGIGYTKIKSTNRNINIVSNFIGDSYQEAEQSSFNVGPFVRYYVDVADKFKFFGQLSTAIGFGKSDQLNTFNYNGTPVTSNSSASNYKFSTFDASINPGFAFFPSKRWAIEFSFPLLNYYKSKPKDIETTNINVASVENFNFAADSFNPSIGFNFHF